MTKKIRIARVKMAIFAVYSACVCSTPNFAFSAEIQTEFRVGVGHSNNINRAPDITLDESIGQIGAVINVISDERFLEFFLESDLSYRNYQEETFENEVVGGVNAIATFKFADDRFQWHVINNFGQQRVDPLAAPTPQNRENVNFLTTGPSLHLPLGRRNQVGAEALYSVADYEIRTLDNERLEGRLWLGRDIRRNLKLSVNVRRLETEFDDPLSNTDFDIVEGFFRIGDIRDRGESSFKFDLGYTELHFGQSTEENGLLARFELVQFIGTYTSVSVFLGTGYGDQSSLFRFNQDSNFSNGSTQNIDGDGVPFRGDYVYAQIDYDYERTRLAGIIGWRKEDYEGRSTRDRTTPSVSITISRDLSRTIFVSLGASLSESKYDIIDRDDRNSEGHITLGYRFGPTLSLTADVQQIRRKSNSPLNDFKENRGSITLYYAPRWDERPR